MNWPHLTIIYISSLPVGQDIWDSCTADNQSIKPPSFKFKLGHNIWDGRVVVLTTEDIELDSPGVLWEDTEFVSKLAQEIQEYLYVTIGTKEDIPAVEAMGLVAMWKEGRNVDGVSLMRLVMSKGVSAGVQSSSPTLTCEKPYPSEGYGFFKGTGKPADHPWVHIGSVYLYKLLYSTFTFSNFSTFFL